MKSGRAPARVRKRNTEEAIIQAAERLFACHGLDGVSLRQIGVAAGGANHYVVQYHFGDKAKLVRAIFAHRLPSLEAKRAKLLTEATQAQRLDDPRALFEVIFRPIAEERDDHGRRSYAAFLSGLRHFEPLSEVRGEADDLAPLTEHVVQVIRAAVPHLPESWFRRRILNAATLFLAAVVDLDQLQEKGEALPIDEEAFLRDALDAATAALVAPLSEEVRAQLEGRARRK